MAPVWLTREVPWPGDVCATVRAFASSSELAWLDDAAAHASGGPRSAHFSMVCRNPLAILEQVDGEDAELRVGRRVADTDCDGWKLWRRAADRLPTAPEGSFGLAPGWVGYVGFEMGRLLERLPASHRESLGLPFLRMSLFDRGVVLDHVRRRAFVVACDGVRDALDLPTAPLDETAGDWGRAISGSSDSAGIERSRGMNPAAWHCASAAHPGDLDSQWRLLMPRADYQRMVERALKYIAAGDIYQANLAHRLRFSDVGDRLTAYSRLRSANPASYAALLSWEGGAVGSLSPELFLRKRGRDVLTRPIKGTRPRTHDAVFDEIHRRELLESEKDAAELAMIVDLHRNDLGRVCEFGSVRVHAARRLEAHPTVFHTVADVAGRLRAECDPFDLLTACFPAGSISGAPKIRALEIIDELEPAARGAYTGAVGAVGLDGSMTFNVAIRTLQFHGDQATLYVGGGIVADSDPDDEYRETLAKGRGIMEGLAGVSNQLGAAR